MRHEVIDDLVAKHIPEKAYPEQWDVDGPQGRRAQQSSTSTCRSRTGRRRKASPTRRSASASTEAADEAAAERAERFGPEIMAYVEKSVAAADARPSVARASRQPRPSALGRRLPRLRPARPAERIQGAKPSSCSRRMLGNLRQAVTGAADARRAGARGRRGAAAAGRRRCMATTSTAPPARTISATTALLRRQDTQRVVAPEERDPEQSGDLGQGRPQRALPLRLRQEVQALPRRLRLSEAPSGLCPALEFRNSSACRSPPYRKCQRP